MDSDTNDVNQINQGNYRVNDTVASAQPIRAPFLLTGTVNRVRTGPAGNNFAPGDEDDYFAVDLVAGQVVELEFASAPNDADVDLYLFSPTGAIVGSSDGVDTRYECVRVAVTGRYVVNVFAFSKASIYNLRIGAPGSAGNCVNSTAAVAAVSGQLLAKAKPLAGAAVAVQEGRLRAAGITGAKWMSPASATSVTVEETAAPQLLTVPADATGQAHSRARLAGEDTNVSAETRARRLSAASAQASPTAVDELGTVGLLKLAKALRQGGGFAYVQPNWVNERTALVGAFPPNDRSYNLQRWHYEQINLPAAMNRIAQLPTQPAPRPVVAVIDSGVMLNHPDLQPQLFSSGRAFITRVANGDGNTASGDDVSGAADKSNFHGTHVAGTVAAATYDGIGGAGTAPMAQLLPLRVFGATGGASTGDVIHAMLYAARLPNNSGTLPARRADVINLSLGSSRPCDAAYQDVVARVRAAGVLVVAAAGNDGRNELGDRAAVGQPFNCTGAIAVSALNAQRGVAHYSNTGIAIVLAAPGGDLRQSTTGSGSPDGVYSDVGTFDAAGRRVPNFGPQQGTSMASPHVAGVLALMRYVNPALTVAQVDALLAQGALSDDLGTPGRDIDYGFGLVNAAKAVEAALAANGAPPPPPPAGRVTALPSSIDFGSLQSTAAFDLNLDAPGTESVVSIVSNNSAVTVTASSIDPATRRGRYTVTVNRSSLNPNTTIYPQLTVSLAPARTLVVQLSVTRPTAGSSASGGDLGPLYVLLINPETGNVERTVLAVRGSTGYTWTTTGWSFPSVQIVAGSDLDNDDLICQRGEACGAYPVLPAGRGLTVLNLAGSRTDLDLAVASLSGASAQNASTVATQARSRRTAFDSVVPAGSRRQGLP
ncbi:MAG: S8 family serine peptidase [Rubrivivax sp.]|nr:S8 family serine peptidase [Rubrivivax sp.]